MPNYVKHILANLRQQFGQKQLTELSTYDINFSLEIKGLVKKPFASPAFAYKHAVHAIDSKEIL